MEEFNRRAEALEIHKKSESQRITQWENPTPKLRSGKTSKPPRHLRNLKLNSPNSMMEAFLPVAKIHSKKPSL